MFYKLCIRLSILVIVLSTGFRASICALYSDLHAGQPSLQAFGQQLESPAYFPSLQVLLRSGNAVDYALALKIIQERAICLNTQDHLGQTALHVAVQQRHLYVVQNLLSAGADMQLRDIDNNTAFDYAISDRNTDIIGLFQSHLMQQQGEEFRQPIRQENIQNNMQNVQEYSRGHIRQNRNASPVNFRKLLLLGCTTGALALLVYKLLHEDNTKVQSSRYRFSTNR